jgi:hypothetical protein
MTEHPQHVVDTRRRAVAWKLVNAAAMMDNVATETLAAEIAADHKFLSEKELQAISKITATMEKCEANLRKLAARMGVES